MNDDGYPESDSMKDKAAGANEEQSDDGILREAKQRLQISIQADTENHNDARDDLQFLKGDQWPERQKRQRESEGRPCLTINKLPSFLQQVTNDQRQNRANIKVSAVSENADETTANIIQGVIRHIEYDSSADVAYDTAVNSASANGFGYFRIVTDYESPTSFNQKLMIKRVRNVFTVHMDPASTEADGSDQLWCFLSEKMAKSEFRTKYPDKQCPSAQGFGTVGQSENLNQNWEWEDQVRVAEYYRIKFTKAVLYLLGDGSTTTEAPPAGAQVMRQRDTMLRTVEWFLLSPYEILERAEIKCPWIPVFPVYGTEIDVDGKVYRAGLIRNAKDPAMMYNFWMTNATEEVSMRPKTPYIGAEGQFEGHENKWKNANTRTYSYLEYKPVTLEGQLAPPPSRQPMADVPIGILSMAQHASDNVKQTTGLFDSSLGAAGNATSGKQELAQQKQGSITNFHYMDNFFRTLRHAGRCLIAMIPAYYDTERVVLCRGEDGSTKGETINKWDAAANKFINDVRVGQYEVAVTPGPSYATMRAEAADAMIEFGKNWPKLMDIAGDKVIRAMNWPSADDIADRVERGIPAALKGDEDGNQEAAIPPEVQQKIAELEQRLQEVQQDADKNRADIKKAEIAAQAQIEAARVGAESRSDVAELNGLVKLLIAQLPPPPELVKDVAEDIGESGSEGSGEVPQMSSAPSMNDPSQQAVE